MFFLPTSNTLVSCFKDDSVFAWDCDSMKCLYQLNSPKDVKPMYRCLAASKDSRTLVAAGRYHFNYWFLGPICLVSSNLLNSWTRMESRAHRISFLL